MPIQKTTTKIINTAASVAGAAAVIYPYAQDVSTAINNLADPNSQTVAHVLFNIVGVSMTTAIASKIFDALNNLTR